MSWLDRSTRPRISWIQGLALGLVWALPLAGADLPDEPRAQGTLLVPGRLPWGPSALPSGEILAPSEDQTLRVLDAQAQVITQWVAPGRIAGPVTVAPRGPTQLFAVPQVTGRVDVLVWDALTRAVAQAWAALHRGGEPAATAWGPIGTLYVGWKDGHVEAWDPHGTRLWEADAGLSLRQVLVDDNLGVYAFGNNGVVLFDGRGREVSRWSIRGEPRGVLQTQAGQILCWTDGGVWAQGPQPGPFVAFDPAPDVLGITVDRQDRVVVTTPKRLRRFSSDRSPATVELPFPAVVGAVLDDRGRCLVGTTRGLEEWSYDGRLLAVLDETPPVAAPVITDQGLAAWGSQDWVVHVWSGFRLPPFGWAQDGGAQGKGFSARRPTSVAVRAVNWADAPEFGYFFELAASGDEAKQRTVLDRFSQSLARGELLSRWPWADLVLLKVARSGLIDLQLSGNRVNNSWPANRLRAYALLAQIAGPEDRDELIAVLAREFDPAVAAQGFQALARSGWDGDGKILRLLAEVQQKMPTQSVVADAVIDAARKLWTVNGRSTDPILVPLVTSVYQGPFPRSVKVKAQQFFQDLIEAP